MITPEQIKQDKQIKTYIERADDTLQALGYTEHSFAHVTRVAHFAQKILEELGYDCLLYTSTRKRPPAKAISSAPSWPKRKRV